MAGSWRWRGKCRRGVDRDRERHTEGCVCVFVCGLAVDGSALRGSSGRRPMMDGDVCVTAAARLPEYVLPAEGRKK